VPGPTSTIGRRSEHLDLVPLSKSRKQCRARLSWKIDRHALRTAIEHAGAQRGLLILPREGEQRIEAEATTSGHTVIVRLQEASWPQPRCQNRSSTMSWRTHESSFWTMPQPRAHSPPMSTFRQHHARSVLCLPLLKQAKLIGVLYSKNNLPRVFTPARIAVLKLLASEAAISLENTRLYKDLKEPRSEDPATGGRQHHRHHLLECLKVGLMRPTKLLRMVEYDREDLASGRVRWRELTPEKMARGRRTSVGRACRHRDL